MLGSWRASRRVRGPRRCFVNEVNLGIACRSSASSRAATALSNWFIADSDWDNAGHRRVAWSTLCSLCRLGGGSPIA